MWRARYASVGEPGGVEAGRELSMKLFPRIRGFVVGTVLAMLLSVRTHGAHADAIDVDASRIVAARHSLKWNWTPPGRSERYGHAETLIHAPLDVVRRHVLDFSRYKDILPARFKVSRVVGHEPDQSTDVYIQISVLHGALALWDVARFAPPQETAPGIEVVEGRMIPGRGNVDDMDVVWTLRALDDQWTVLKFDILLKPGLPAPQSLIDEELRDSAMFAVDAIHDRAQGTRAIEPWPNQG
jgi:hypothetical protein